MAAEKDKTHNQLCTCGLEKVGNGDPCSCPCKMCADYRAALLRHERLRILEERLQKAGIYPAELADLLWMHLEPSFEARIEKITRDVLRSVLKELKMQTRVSGTSLDW